MRRCTYDFNTDGLCNGTHIISIRLVGLLMMLQADSQNNAYKYMHGSTFDTQI